MNSKGIHISFIMNFANYIHCLHIILFSVKYVRHIFLRNFNCLSCTLRMTLIYFLSKVDSGFIGSYWIIICCLNIFAGVLFKEEKKQTDVLKTIRHVIPYMNFTKQVCLIKISLWAVNYKRHQTNVYKYNELFME